MLFALRLFAYRLVKPLQWPTSRVVAIPRPTTFVGPDAALSCATPSRSSACGASWSSRTRSSSSSASWSRCDAPSRKRGVNVAVHDGITPDPTYDVLQRGLGRRPGRTAGDAILAVGGGSVIDAAKVIDAMVVSGQECGEAVGMLKVGKPMLAAVRGATTAGNGLGGDGRGRWSPTRFRAREVGRSRPQTRADRGGARPAAHQGGCRSRSPRRRAMDCA